MEKLNNKTNQIAPYLLKTLGKKCKIFIKQNYIINGTIYSIDNFFNLLVFDSYINKSHENFKLQNYSSLRFIRGENILLIMY